MTARFRVFVSSPSDVFAERERLERVIQRLNGELGGDMLEAVRWEHAYYSAAKTFQDQIPLPSQTDLVVCILWKRLGFELPPEYRRPDGTTPTGTEFEFEDAMQAARSRGTPDVLVYRKSAPVLLAAERVEIEHAQFEQLKSFWGRWFQSDAGHFTAAYQSFETTDGFETDVEGHIRQWLARHHVSGGAVWPIAQKGSPFRGLEAFDAGHSEVFFGRRRTVERARERLAEAARRGGPFLLVLGASGSGKSSLARAGLLPRLIQPGATAGVDVWRSCILRPSEAQTPCLAFARGLHRALPELALGDTPDAGDFALLLAAAPAAAARAVRLALVRATEKLVAREGFDRAVDARLLVVIDQFEEALVEPVQCQAFALALQALVATGLVWIIATLRSDLYAAFQASPPLMALREAGAQLDLMAPTPAELAEIVTGPANASGLRFDTRADGTGLDEVLVEAAGESGALPLLQLTLDTLFEARDLTANLLTFAAYDALGGLAGIVEQRAEQAMAALDEPARGALPGVLRQLVHVTAEGVVTGRSAPEARVLRTPHARQLVAAFTAARLLVAETHGEVTSLRIAHDALLTAWPQAATLIAADLEALRTRARLEQAARRWADEAHDPDLLLPPGRPLAEALDLRTAQPDSLDARCLAFVEASEAADQARAAAAQSHAQRGLRLEAEAQEARADAAHRIVRRTRIAAGVVLLLGIAAVGGAFTADRERQLAVQRTAEAERNFEAALGAGASLVDATHDHLHDGGMSRDVAGFLLRTAEATMGGLARVAPADASPDLGDAQARLQSSFSAVQLALCDSAGARARAEDAVAVAAAMQARAPSPERQLAVLRARDALGQAQFGDADTEAALRTYGEAETEAASRPASEAFDLALAGLRRDRAVALLSKGDTAAALPILRHDLALQQNRLAAAPDEPATLGLAAIDLRWLTSLALKQNDNAAAATAAEAELALLRRLQTLRPLDKQWAAALSVNTQQRAELATRQANPERALALAQQAVALAEPVAAHDPGNAEWGRILATAKIRYGGLLAIAGQTAAAVEVMRSAGTLIETLAGPQASSMRCKGDAAQLHTMLGFVQMMAQDPAAAVAAQKANLALATEIAAAAPGDPQRAHDLVTAHAALALAYRFAHRTAEAAAEYRAAMALLVPLTAHAPANPDWRHELGDLRVGLGETMLKSGDAEGARRLLADAGTAAEAAAKAEPGVAEWRHQIVADSLSMFDVELVAGNLPAMLELARHARDQARSLVQAEPDSAPWQVDLIDALVDLSIAEETQSQAPAALADLHAAEAQSAHLAAAAPNDPRWANLRAMVFMRLADVAGSLGAADEAAGYKAQEAAIRARLARK